MSEILTGKWTNTTKGDGRSSPLRFTPWRKEEPRTTSLRYLDHLVWRKRILPVFFTHDNVVDNGFMVLNCDSEGLRWINLVLFRAISSIAESVARP